MAHPLPTHLSLEQLRKRAKELRDFVRSGHAKGIMIARELHPRWTDATNWAEFTLADAQLVLARSLGYPSWPRLRADVELVNRYSRSPQRHPAGGDLVDEFLRLACLTYCSSWSFGDGEEADDQHRQADARALLAAHSHLASATIHTAAAVGDIAATDSLLTADASLANREGGPHGWPPLLYLCFSRLNSTEPEHSTLEVARLLLAHGADPNAGYLPDGDARPVTALSGAFHGQNDPVNQPAHQYSLPLARMLLDAGADPNDSQAVGNACNFPHDDAGLALLLEHGLGRSSDGPWRTRLGERLPTPAQLLQDELRSAAQWNLADRARMLLRRCAETGADINARAGGPDACQTAYEFAVVAGNTEIVDLLTAGAQASLDPTFELIGACLRADRPAVDRLLASDPTLAARAVGTPWWPEPLDQAAALNRPDAVPLLVSLGFPVNTRRASPLHVAALFGHLDVVRLLVDLGADPAAESVNDTPGTPLRWASYLHHHEVVAYLTRLTT